MMISLWVASVREEDMKILPDISIQRKAIIPEWDEASDFQGWSI